MLNVSIVIVNYKYRLDILRVCLESIAASQEVTYEVFFIDNSAEEANAELCRKYEHITYIANEENVGFARAVNQGMRLATGEYILLLNGDVVFSPRVLCSMLDHLRKDGQVGIASCVIRYPNGELQPSIRRFPTPWNQFLVMSKIPHLWTPSAHKAYMAYDIDPYQTQEVESIMGAFMWISRPTLDQIGLFDETFFLWFEEVDYCYRAVTAGIPIKHYADIEVFHKKGAAFSTVQTWRKQRWMRQSLRWYMRKHFGFWVWLLYWVLQPWFLATATVAHIFKRY